MDTTFRKYEIVQNAVSLIGLTFALILDFDIRWNMKIHWTVILLSASVCFVLLFLIDYNKKNILTYIVVIGMFSSGGLLFSLLKGNIIKHIESCYQWFNHYSNTGKNYQITYSFVTIIAGIIFVSFCYYLISKKRILRYITVSGIFLWLIYCAFIGINVNKGSISCLFVLIFQTIIELCNVFYNKKKLEYHNRLIFYLLPICILTGIIAVMLPSKKQPIQWIIIKRFVSTVADKWEDVSFNVGVFTGKYSDDFQVNFTGFSDKDKKLGGKINSNKKVMLKVYSNEETYGSTYLIGGIRDEYTSSGWNRSKIDYDTEQEPTVDFYQLLHGLYQYKIMPIGNEVLFHKVKLTLNYDNIKTKNLFYPLKAYQMQFDKDIRYDSSSPTLIADHVLRKGFSYDVNYFEINYESDTIKNYLRKISGVNSKDTNNLLNGSSIQNFRQSQCIDYLKRLLNMAFFDLQYVNKDFYQLIDNREKNIKKYYTKLPNTIPNRVYDLARDITKEYDNNYDKLRAIEQYLSSFDYTLAPSKTKKGEDFVDYFLFKQKKGYCTYFATAMAVLARCIDIPTRYVEGILIDDQLESDQYYLAKSSTSHAWVEAYFEGVGWIPFEPTKSMQSDRYCAWKVKQKESSAGGNIAVPVPTPPAMLTNMSQENHDINVRLAKERAKQVKYMVRYSSMIIGILVLLCVLIVICLSYNRNKRYRNASKEEKIKYMIRDILDYLSVEGFEKTADETLMDYIKRVGEQYDFDTVSFSDVGFIYMKMRYASMEIDEMEMNKIYTYHNLLKEHMKGKVGLSRRMKYQFSTMFRN
ncbi:transglutaminase domain-containing protein [Anaeromicropila herbilytica]|uniref:Transglutaminase-like domain-containing protein n=1 Tax=Anaeromicropila herbilytica TaxID=2785025 RepID=A0A7R7EIL0_9FIRM|nr:transglutaminase domain-containing protein [Anaeromicropila herbilytica]BCN29415.1 hypothetical protein bsdtb5_07100 [Anaeromicropila herbilytica]